MFYFILSNFSVKARQLVSKSVFVIKLTFPDFVLKTSTANLLNS